MLCIDQCMACRKPILESTDIHPGWGSNQPINSLNSINMG